MSARTRTRAPARAAHGSARMLQRVDETGQRRTSARRSAQMRQRADETRTSARLHARAAARARTAAHARARASRRARVCARESGRACALVCARAREYGRGLLCALLYGAARTLVQARGNGDSVRVISEIQHNVLHVMVCIARYVSPGSTSCLARDTSHVHA